MPKVTVLMSVHNGKKYLREAMESILNQTFCDFEFLIIDDASTDSTPAILLSYTDPRIRLIKNETNLGLTKSLNIGLRASIGEYVARMDADDVSLLERLEKQVAYLDEHPDDALVGSRVEVIDEDGRTIQKPSAPAPSWGMLYYGLAFNNVMAHSSTMFRRRAVEDLNGYDESFRQSQDYDLWYRLSRLHGIHMLDEPLVKWRMTSESVTEKQGEAQKERAREIFGKHAREIVPGISTRMLERLVRYHDGSVVWPSFADIVAFWRFHRAIVGERRALSKKLTPKRSNPKSGVVDFKMFVALCLPGLYKKMSAARRKKY